MGRKTSIFLDVLLRRDDGGGEAGKFNSHQTILLDDLVPQVLAPGIWNYKYGCDDYCCGDFLHSIQYPRSDIRSLDEFDALDPVDLDKSTNACDSPVTGGAMGCEFDAGDDGPFTSDTCVQDMALDVQNSDVQVQVPTIQAAPALDYACAAVAALSIQCPAAYGQSCAQGCDVNLDAATGAKGVQEDQGDLNHLQCSIRWVPPLADGVGARVMGSCAHVCDENLIQGIDIDASQAYQHSCIYLLGLYCCTTAKLIEAQFTAEMTRRDCHAAEQCHLAMQQLAQQTEQMIAASAHSHHETIAGLQRTFKSAQCGTLALLEQRTSSLKHLCDQARLAFEEDGTENWFWTWRKPFATGSSVVLQGLSNDKFNSQFAEVCGYDSAKQRLQLSINGQPPILVKPENAFPSGIELETRADSALEKASSCLSL